MNKLTIIIKNIKNIVKNRIKNIIYTFITYNLFRLKFTTSGNRS